MDPVRPRAVVLKSGLLSPLQRWSVAVVHGGADAGLAGLTALEYVGMQGWRRRGTYLLVPHGRPPTPLPWLVVHQSRHLDEAHWRRDLWPACTTPARAAIDAASWQRSERAALGVVLATAQQRLASPASMLAVLDELPRVRHSVALTQALADAASGADSLAEVDVARIMREVGLGTPRRQELIETPDGPRPADLAVDLPDGRTLVVEVDGPHHDDPAVRVADAAKDAAFVAAGCLVLRIPWVGVRERRDVVRAQLAAVALAARRRASG